MAHPSSHSSSGGKRNWISSAIKTPGALHKSLGIPASKNIPKKTLTLAATKSGKLGQRARLAQTLSKLRGK